ncbi:MAG: hypothetical protein GF398_04740 [Chitinivibrionales bacterium]|nr:hypothetical protein [Chitinivibrionales bacterium]
MCSNQNSRMAYLPFGRGWLLILCLAVVVYVPKADGLSGIAVSTRSQATHPLGHQTGAIYRHIISDDRLIDRTALYAGDDARAATINPSGTRIAFLRRDNALCMKSLRNRGEVIILKHNIDWKTSIDWAGDEWIYFIKRRQHRDLMRVNVLSRTVERVATFPYEIYCISIAREGKEGVAVANNNGWKVYLFTVRSAKAVIMAEAPGNCAAISPDGSHFCSNASTHVQAGIRLSQQDTAVASLKPLHKEAGHYLNRLVWSANSKNWLSATQGGNSNEGGYRKQAFHNQLIYHRNGAKAVQVTHNSRSNPGYDEGNDFWVGNPNNITLPAPMPALSRDSLHFLSEAGDSANPRTQQILLGNCGGKGTILPPLTTRCAAPWLSARVESSDDSIWCRVSVRREIAGMGKSEARVILEGDGIDPHSFYVGYTVNGLPVFTSAEIFPESASVHPGDTLYFSAVARDQNGRTLQQQPSFSWHCDGSGSVSPNGMFVAGKKTGTYTISARARQNSHKHEATALLHNAHTLLRINAGGKAWRDWIGAEDFVEKGERFVHVVQSDTVTEVLGLPVDIWQSALEHNPAIRIPGSLVSKGAYHVRLYVADEAGSDRVMNIYARNELIVPYYRLAGLDTLQGIEFGIIEFELAVTDTHGLLLEIGKGYGNDGIISAVEILDKSLAEPALTLLAPNGSERVRPGDSLEIRWQADTNRVDAVMLYYSLDNGANWSLLTPNRTLGASTDGRGLGKFIWRLPYSGARRLTSNACRVKVQQYNSSHQDMSDNAFEIMRAQASEDEHPAPGPFGEFGIHVQKQNNVVASVPYDGGHKVSIVGIDGKHHKSISGSGPRKYFLSDEVTTSGIYLIKLTAGNHKASRIVMISN